MLLGRAGRRWHVRVWSLGVPSGGFIQGLGFRAQEVQGFGFRVRFWVQEVQGLGFRFWAQEVQTLIAVETIDPKPKLL